MKRKGRGFMSKIDEIVVKDGDKNKNTLLWVLGILGAVVAIAGIAYAVYRYVAPKRLSGFEDDFDDDFEDEF